MNHCLAELSQLIPDKYMKQVCISWDRRCQNRNRFLLVVICGNPVLSLDCNNSEPLKQPFEQCYPQTTLSLVNNSICLNKLS